VDARDVDADVVHDVGGLRRPRRQCAEPWHHPQRRVRGRRFGRIQYFREASVEGRRELRLRFDEVHLPGAAHANAPGDRTEAQVESVEAEIRQGAAPVEDDHGDGETRPEGAGYFSSPARSAEPTSA